jgi:predicted TIM-barrel fold metal-dependent hydrolase
MGGDAWWEGIRAAQQAPNLYLEICATYSDPDKVRAAIEAVGVERVLFGTDSTLFDAAHMLGAVADAGLTAREQELVLGENARRLFRLQLPGS